MSGNRRKRKSYRARGNDRRFTVRGVRRNPTDVGKFSKALLGLAVAEAERQAQAEHAARADQTDKSEVASNPHPPSKGGDDVEDR